MLFLSTILRFCRTQVQFLNLTQSTHLERPLVEQEPSVAEHAEGGELPDLEAAAGILDVLRGHEGDAKVVELVVDVLQLVQDFLAFLKRE